MLALLALRAFLLLSKSYNWIDLDGATEREVSQSLHWSYGTYRTDGMPLEFPFFVFR